MRIEHFAVFVNDLEACKNFYVKYFDVKVGHLYDNPNNGFRSYFLTFEDGARLEIMDKPGIVPSGPYREHMGYIHLAISVGSREKVDELTELIKNDGYTVLRGPRITGDGYYESVIIDNENNAIEITV